MEQLITTHDDMNWTVLESEYLMRRPWMTVRREKVLLPTGKIHPEYYLLEYPTWVNIIAITCDGEFVMVRQYRHGLGDTRYELVAGCAEEGEDPETAARRELFEETGYSGGQWKEIACLSPNPSSNTNLSHSFLAVGVTGTGTQHLDETEDIEVHLLTREQVLHLLHNDEIKQALMASALWKYFALFEGKINIA